MDWLYLFIGVKIKCTTLSLRLLYFRLLKKNCSIHATLLLPNDVIFDKKRGLQSFHFYQYYCDRSTEIFF